MKEDNKKLFNMFAREIVSNKQYIDDSILDNLKGKEIRYTEQFRQIPVYPISPYEWINKVSLSGGIKNEDI